jgi:exosortase
MQFLRLSRSFSKEQLTYILSLLCALFILGYVLFETLKDLNMLWQFNNEAYSHGYMLLGLVLYSLYERRDLFVFKPTYTALPFALILGLVWTATNSINIKLAEYLLLPVIFFLFIVSYVGWNKAFRFALPLAALFFALPIIGFLNPLLQTLTVKVVSNWVSMTSITAYIDGFFITLPSGILHVHSSCSGLSYLSAGITFGMIYSFLSIKRKRIVAFSLLLIIALSLLANWVRVFILVAVAYESDMQSSLVEEHGFLGWIIFAFVFMLYLFVMRKIEVRYDNIPAKNDTSNTHNNSNTTNKMGFLSSASPVMLAISIGLAPTYASIIKHSAASASNTNISVPEFFSDAKIENYNNQDSVFFLGADEAYKISGAQDDIVYNAYVILYKTQNQGKELIYYKNKVGENLKGQKQIVLEGTSVNYAVEQGPKDSLVFWFYRVGESEALTPFSVKASQLKNMFHNVPAEAIILKVKCELKCASTIDSEEILKLLEQLRSIKIVEQKSD